MGDTERGTQSIMTGGRWRVDEGGRCVCVCVEKIQSSSCEWDPDGGEIKREGDFCRGYSEIPLGRFDLPWLDWIGRGRRGEGGGESERERESGKEGREGELLIDNGKKSLEGREMRVALVVQRKIPNRGKSPTGCTDFLISDTLGPSHSHCMQRCVPGPFL